jgi:hypothetical protein
MRESPYLNKLFDYHNPDGIDPKRFENIRAKAKEFSMCVLENGGNGDFAHLYGRSKDVEQSIEQIRLAVYYAIASIVVPK